MHYTGGLTQAEVAARLGVSAAKEHRLVALANQIGAVRVTGDGDVVESLQLEARLSERFGLRECRVVPDLAEPGLPLKALGQEGARFLEQAIAEPRVDLIGPGDGRTLSATIDALPRVDASRTRFVSLLGGLTRNYAANPHDVLHRLAAKTRAEAHLMPVPTFANSTADRELLIAQRSVSEVFQLARQADLMVVGIGTGEPDAQIVASRMVEPEEIFEVQRRGGVGEMLGHFFAADGEVVDTPLSARTVSPDLRGRRIVAIAGGAAKIAAIRAVLRSGIITDEVTARRLEEPAAA